MVRRKDIPPELKSTIDLGLSDLLGVKAVEPPPDSPGPTQDPPKATESPNEEVSPWEKLAQEEQWAELAIECERRLPPQLSVDERLATLELRLWWAKCQERLRSLPLSILAAPLEELAIALQKQLNQPDAKFSVSRRSRLRTELCTLIAVVERALKDPHDQGIADRLRVLRLAISGSSHLTAEATVVASERPDLALDANRQKLRSGFEGPQAGSGSESRRGSRGWLLGLGILLVVVGLGLCFWFFMDERPQEIAVLPQGSPNELSDGLRNPTLLSEPLKPIQGTNQLDAILEDIKNDRPKLDGLRPHPGNMAISSGAQAGVPLQVAQSSASASVARSPAPRGEIVDTSGPLEPRDFPRLSSPQSDRTEDRRQPRDSSRRPSAERPGFEDFSKPRLYRTLVETDVMPMATLRARPLDTLPPNIEVLVEGREGYWLKIRSQKGKVGYILAQDAVRAD